MSKWTTPLPIWVSRPTAGGLISSFTLPLWLFFLIGMLIALNALVWSAIGLVEAVQYVL